MRKLVLCSLIVGAIIAGLAPASAQAPVVVNVGAASTTSDAPIYIADKKGYFREEGLEVEGHELPLGRRHGGAARHRPARCRRGLRFGRPLQRDAARHQDQDRRRQGFLAAGLWRDQDSGAQRPCRQRALQGRSRTSRA